MSRHPASLGRLPDPRRRRVIACLAALLAASCAAPDAQHVPGPTTPGARYSLETSSPSGWPAAAPSQAVAAAPQGAAPPVRSAAPVDPSPSTDVAPAAGRSPSPATATAPRPTQLPDPEPFSLSLYHANDWVPQYTLTWCVGASMQMMINVAQPGQDRSRKRQEELMLLAQGGTNLTSRGAGSHGWARALTELGVGNYQVAYAYSYEDALRMAARAIRETRLPVGLLVWGGKHAWVMTGFTSIGDPRIHDDFTVTGVRVLDPLHPRPNSDLGPSPAPNTLLKPNRLDDYFVGWSWWSRNTSSLSDTQSSFGRWRLVLPVAG